MRAEHEARSCAESLLHLGEMKTVGMTNLVRSGGVQAVRAPYEGPLVRGILEVISTRGSQELGDV